MRERARARHASAQGGGAGDTNPSGELEQGPLNGEGSWSGEVHCWHISPAPK